jgi:hypothetical protein
LRRIRRNGPPHIVDLPLFSKGIAEHEMTGTSTVGAGIEIPSSDPAFLVVVAVHVLFGLASTITGIVAMLSPKRSSRHPWLGTIYLLVSDGIIRDC